MASKASSLAAFRSSLHSFISSPNSLRVLRTVPPAREATSILPSQLLVLDSSFNPPTKAHLGILSSAVAALPQDRPTRLILLLATQNADKPTKPASFEHRLCMMESLAKELLDGLKLGGRSNNLSVDIGVTKLPYFVGKAAALESADNYAYGASSGLPVQQVHLIGYDTLIRIFDPKYYPPEHRLTPLQGLFENHSLRVTCRTDSGWGDATEQTAYLEAIRSGQRKPEGAEQEWADQITLVTSTDGDDNAVSSTKAREAAARSDESQIRELCPPRVAQHVLNEALYAEEG